MRLKNVQRDVKNGKFIDKNFRSELPPIFLWFREFPEPENCPLPHTGRRSRQIGPLMLPEKKFVAQVGLDPATGQ